MTVRRWKKQRRLGLLFQAASALMVNRPGVRFEAVSGGGHENTYLVAAPAYRAALVELSRR